MFVAKHEIDEMNNFVVCEFHCFGNYERRNFAKFRQNFASRETANIASYEVMSIRRFHDLPQT